MKTDSKSILSNADRDAFTDALRAHAPRYAALIGFEPDTNLRAWLADYYALVMRWNARLHLVAPCSPEEFATRHVLESLCALFCLPHGASVTDVGSGAGLPLILCLIARADLRGIFIEANVKKAVFLREALRELGLKGAHAATHQVINARFEGTSATTSNVLTCRALERFAETLPRLIKWTRAQTLVLFGGENLRAAIEREGLVYEAALLPESEQRFIFHIQRELA